MKGFGVWGLGRGEVLGYYAYCLLRTAYYLLRTAYYLLRTYRQPDIHPLKNIQICNTY